ncbi:hypothetical protein [Chryseobacterium sp.]|uniref:hypothetical protein n=1 Tax=Chryseobacterium sp. TaxID=1871047 RepID=UPI00321A7F20
MREIQGGAGIGKCDIGPIGCPCKIPPGDPCLGGPGGGGQDYGYCPDIQSNILCTETCPNGMQPYCASGL